MTERGKDEKANSVELALSRLRARVQLLPQHGDILQSEVPSEVQPFRQGWNADRETRGVFTRSSNASNRRRHFAIAKTTQREIEMEPLPDLMTDADRQAEAELLAEAEQLALAALPDVELPELQPLPDRLAELLAADEHRNQPTQLEKHFVHALASALGHLDNRDSCGAIRVIESALNAAGAMPPSRKPRRRK